MLSNTKFAAIAVVASIILIGSQADAQTSGTNSCNRQQESSNSVTFPRNDCSVNRGLTITNSAANAGNKQRKYQNRFDNVRNRQPNNQLNLRSQRDQPNRFGVAGRNSYFNNPRVKPSAQQTVFVPQIPTPAPRPRPRLIPNEFIVGLSNRSKFANVFKKTAKETQNPETEVEVTRGQPIGNPYYSILVFDE